MRTVRGFFLEGVSDRFSSQHTRSSSGYGQVTLHLSPTTRLTGGLRYSRDEIIGEQFLIGTNSNTVPPPSAVSRAGQISSLVTPRKA